MKAIWNNTVIADSAETVVVEGNHYFPPASLKEGHFQPSTTHTTCGWKGVASYYTVSAGGAQNPDAAWFYSSPKEAANQIAGYVAFWKGVQVVA
jgi:uncharacterized protein (DUF427 family)